MINFFKKNKNKKIVILDIPLLLENKIKKKMILLFLFNLKNRILKRLKKEKILIKNFKKFKNIQLPLIIKKKSQIYN